MRVGGPGSPALTARGLVYVHAFVLPKFESRNAIVGYEVNDLVESK